MLFILSILILDATVVYLICKKSIFNHQRELTDATDLSSSRLLYIRSLMYLVYTHSHQSDRLLKHLKTEMAASKILSYHIVKPPNPHLFVPGQNLRETDKLFFQLDQEGFTPQELCIIFNLNNLNAVYVKCHRIKKKLNQQTEKQEKTSHK